MMEEIQFYPPDEVVVNGLKQYLYISTDDRCFLSKDEKYFREIDKERVSPIPVPTDIGLPPSYRFEVEDDK